MAIITSRVDFADDGSKLHVQEMGDNGILVWRDVNFWMEKHSVSRLIQVVQPDAMRDPRRFVGIFETAQS